MLQRMFSLWFNGFVYNQIWEDPEVDLEALQIQPGSRIMTISSGGCNVLNYLISKPEAIVAVDLNPYHMYLTRLKLAALGHLPSYADFFAFFGKADQKKNIDNYNRYIRDHLDKDTRRFWESRTWFGQVLGPKRIHYFGKNFYRYARFGHFVRFMHRFAKLAGCDIKQLKEAKTLADQEAIFEKYIAPFFRNAIVKKVGKMSFAVFSLGIPPQQYQAMKDESDGQLINLYHDRLKRLFCQFPIQDNYFAWQAIGLSYDTEQGVALPPYLKPENYAVMKQHLSRITTHIASFGEFLQSQPDNTLDRFVLLDSQDWMTPPVLTELWGQIARVGRPGTRIIFRTASSLSPIETALPPTLRSQFEYHKEISAELFQRDRSAIYGGFHLYVKPN
jgi:S-adenosylmethionine-diacylglycerol 3-amino-3-carboxypropyl transferase